VVGVTTDDMRDSEVLPSLVMDASRHRSIVEAFMDGAYDSSNSYTILRRIGVKPSLSLEEMLEWMVDLLRDVYQ
jgi:hypothetical protein